MTIDFLSLFAAPRTAGLSFALALFAALVLSPAQAADKDDDQAEAFIADLAVDTLDLVSDADISEVERLGRFRRLMVDNTDFRRFGRSALGRYSRQTSDIEFAEYLDALEDYAVKILSSRFALFTDHTVNVTGSRVRQGKRSRYVVVATDLFDTLEEKVAEIHWVLVNSDDKYQIFDIVVQTPGESGTFSLLKTQRDEFSRILSANGRDTYALVAHLRQSAANNQLNGAIASRVQGQQ